MPGTTGSPQRVPAWKRIGLKLKYAKEAVREPSNGTGPDHSISSAKITDQATRRGVDADARPSKRRKASPEIEHSDRRSPSTNGVSTSSDVTAHSQLASAKQPQDDNEVPEADLSRHIYEPPDQLESEHAPPPDFQGKTRRKSVTFTPETKQQDGFGASALFKRLISEGEAQESRPAPDQSVNLVAATKESKDPIVQPGPPESGKKQRKARAPVPNGGSPKYVDYLRSFHTDKSSWKFNTKRQKQLLENLFNIDTIPPQDQAALLQYLSGLQGSAARRRVVESALAVLQQIAEKDEVYQAESTMESEEERRAAYQAALNRHLERYAQAGAQAHDYDEQQLDELRREAESGKRAEAVLREMLEKELYPDRVASTEPQTSQSSSLRASTDDTTSLPRSTNSTTTAMPGSKRKKRKARTQGIVEDSSEESSDSESSVKRTKPTSNGHSTSLATSSAPSARPFHQDLQQKSLGKKKIFDDDLLDQMFPKKSTDKWRK